MPTNVYFSQGTRDEQYLIEDLILESIKIYGQEFMYIPRSLVAKDEILGEDRLSEFKSAFPIEMYLETVDGFAGQGAFIQKFGLMMEQSATLTVARRRWNQLVGRFGQTQIPTRPNEGDLLYFPLSGGLFEIKFVQHQDPFYQLGKLYVYKLEIELFQYASEHIDTGVKEIDEFETLKSFTTNISRSGYGEVSSVTMTNGGSGYAAAPTVVFTSSSGSGAAGIAIISSAGEVTGVTITATGTGYKTAPTISFVADSDDPGIDAAATSTVTTEPDDPESYGDNTKFSDAAEDVLFNEDNPFGEV